MKYRPVEGQKSQTLSDESHKVTGWGRYNGPRRSFQWARQGARAYRFDLENGRNYLFYIHFLQRRLLKKLPGTILATHRAIGIESVHART